MMANIWSVTLTELAPVRISGMLAATPKVANVTMNGGSLR